MFQDSLVNKVSAQHQSHGNNILLVKSGTSFLSKICSHITHIYNFKKYDYPRVIQTVSNNLQYINVFKLNTFKIIKTKLTMGFLRS